MCILHSENDLNFEVNVCVVGWGGCDGGDQ